MLAKPLGTNVSLRSRIAWSAGHWSWSSFQLPYLRRDHVVFLLCGNGAFLVVCIGHEAARLDVPRPVFEVAGIRRLHHDSGSESTLHLRDGQELHAPLKLPCARNRAVLDVQRRVPRQMRHADLHRRRRVGSQLRHVFGRSPQHDAADIYRHADHRTLDPCRFSQFVAFLCGYLRVSWRNSISGTAVVAPACADWSRCDRSASPSFCHESASTRRWSAIACQFTPSAPSWFVFSACDAAIFRASRALDHATMMLQSCGEIVVSAVFVVGIVALRIVPLAL